MPPSPVASTSSGPSSPSIPSRPTAAKTRNPADAFELYQVHSRQKQPESEYSQVTGPFASLSDEATYYHNHSKKKSIAATDSAFTSGQVTPITPGTPPGFERSHSYFNNNNNNNGGFSASSSAQHGLTSTNASARASAEQLPTHVLPNSTANSSRALLPSAPNKPYNPHLVHFKGKVLVSDPGFKLFSLAYAMLLMGWADASNGALLPYIQEYYQLEYLQVATLFIANFAGWVLSAIVNPYLTDRQGLGRALVVGGCIMSAAIAVICAAPPFPVVATAFVGVGLGIGILGASTTSWSSGRPDPTIKLGITLATYGLGALLAPIAAGLLTQKGIFWARFYLISLGLCVGNTIILAFSFRFESEESWYARKAAYKEARRGIVTGRELSKLPSNGNRSDSAEERGGEDDAGNSLQPSTSRGTDRRADSTITRRMSSRVSQSNNTSNKPASQVSWKEANGAKGLSTRDLPEAFEEGDEDDEQDVGSAERSAKTTSIRTIDEEGGTRRSSQYKIAEGTTGGVVVGVPLTTGADAPPTPMYSTTSDKFRGLSKMKVMWILALFAFSNTGTEVAVGGWTSSYLRDYRHTDHGTSEWIISAFWGGLMIGRIVLIPVSKYIGEQRAMYIYLSSWAGLEVVVWVVPNLISTGVAVGLAGFAMGPCFPIVASLTTQWVRPRALHTAALGLITCAAQSGSAFFPFIVGLMAQAEGLKVLQPFVVACLGAQIGIWMLFGWPRKPNRTSQMNED